MNQVEIYDEIDDILVAKWEYDNYEDALGKMEALLNIFSDTVKDSIEIELRHFDGGAA